MLACSSAKISCSEAAMVEAIAEELEDVKVAWLAG